MSSLGCMCRPVIEALAAFELQHLSKSKVIETLPPPDAHMLCLGSYSNWDFFFPPERGSHYVTLADLELDQGGLELRDPRAFAS